MGEKRNSRNRKKTYDTHIIVVFSPFKTNLADFLYDAEMSQEQSGLHCRPLNKAPGASGKADAIISARIANILNAGNTDTFYLSQIK